MWFISSKDSFGWVLDGLVADEGKSDALAPLSQSDGICFFAVFALASGLTLTATCESTGGRVSSI